ncbi:hypothetical protein F2Q68_00008596, partial [Brassica cretica]
LVLLLWTPFQYVMATPLLVAFEILLFLHLEDKYDDLKFVFLPLLAFEVAILVYNVRKCLTSMPRDEEFMIDEPLLVSWLFSRDEETMGDESLLYTWVSIWMVSFIADITFTLVKSRGDLVALELWDLSINFGIAELFGFPVTKWRNQSIHRDSHILFSSSVGVRYRNEDSTRECDILDIGATVLFVTYTSVVKSVLWIYNVGGPYGRYLARSLARVFLRFFQHCKRCNTLSPEAVKKMPKSHLVEEVCRLKAALSEQTDSSQQEKNICKVCFEDPVNVVLFPCSHHVLCSFVMLVPGRVMRWKRVWKSFQAVSANGFIFSFTLLIALKLDHLLSHSWWFVFTPLWWLCHAIISRGRCSLPSPPMPHDENWTPFQYVMATPLLVAFEILLFLHLEDKYDVDLTFVFLPLLSFEVAILVVNLRYFIKVLRKCLTRMPRNEETMSDEPLLYTWVSIWMVSFIAAITFTLIKSRAALELWDLSINFGIAELFGFLCAKWRKRSIHSDSHIPSSSSMGVRYGDEDSNIECGLLDIGGYVMKIPFITFQFILFLSLEGTPASPKKIPVLVLFVPLFLLQGAVVLSVTYISFSKSVLWIYNVGGPYGRYLARSSARVFLRFFQHCKRYKQTELLGCWSINEGSKEEQVRLHSGETTGYNTFLPKAALSEQTDSSQQEKNLAKFALRIRSTWFYSHVNITSSSDHFVFSWNTILYNVRVVFVCFSTCCKKCKTCPICRELIKLRMPVYDA